MITIFSGVPGSGKTSYVVEMIMEELKQGRKVYTIGIPSLLLNVHEGGHPHTWQDGDWLQIDRFDPKLTRDSGIQSQWFPRECPTTCQFLSTCSRAGTRPPDAGSLVVIDESHAYFPQRASGSKPPRYIEAFNVHRHQGLDFWLVTQRPSFLDPFIRGLCSRHIHIQLNPFSFSNARNKYEWTEYQESVTKGTKMLAAKSSYKPSPAVFPLYASATVHTKLEQRMPTILKVFFFAVAVLLLMVGLVVQRVQSRMDDINKPKNSELSQKTQTGATPSSSGPSSGSAPAAARSEDGGALAIAAPVSGVGEVAVFNTVKLSSCIADSQHCQCYDDRSVRVVLPEWECRKNVNNITHDFDLDDKRPVNTAELLHAPAYHMPRPGITYREPEPDREPMTLHENAQQLVYTKTTTH